MVAVVKNIMAALLETTIAPHPAIRTITSKVAFYQLGKLVVLGLQGVKRFLHHSALEILEIRFYVTSSPIPW
jgi:hypothetical protein